MTKATDSPAIDRAAHSVRCGATMAVACAVAVLFVTTALLWSQANAANSGIPEGFTPIFNGKDTKGWHWSKTNHHGSNGIAKVENGELVLKQHPIGQGGILVTNKRYHNFELYLEVKELAGCNSGLFLRSTEGGSAYQVEL